MRSNQRVLTREGKARSKKWFTASANWYLQSSHVVQVSRGYSEYSENDGILWSYARSMIYNQTV